MSPWRRRLLLASVASAAAAGGLGVRKRAEAANESSSGTAIQHGRRLGFPRDHGAHLPARTEWWYATGWMAADAAHPAQPTHGFQVTFFRSRTQWAQAAPSVAGAAGNRTSPGAPTGPNAGTGIATAGRFAAQHLLFAHAAITDLAAGRHHHAQRIARWNGEPAAGPDRASLEDTALTLARWQLRRDGTPASPTWSTQLRAEGFALRATMRGTQPVLLQGEAGFSRKGPEERQASHYYSVPQLATQLELELQGRRFTGAGRAWLDHEWSDELLHPQAVGWDWIGFNLFDGGALTAFRLRRADGSTLWAGGSFRSAAAPNAPARSFEPGEVLFTASRRWRSAATNADYPVQWLVHTPAGRHRVRALLDAQELDSRGGTGAVYWEGLAELLDGDGLRVGLGYLEMTGYAAPIKLG